MTRRIHTDHFPFTGNHRTLGYHHVVPTPPCASFCFSVLYALTSLGFLGGVATLLPVENLIGGHKTPHSGWYRIRGAEYCRPSLFLSSLAFPQSGQSGPVQDKGACNLELDHHQPHRPPTAVRLLAVYRHKSACKFLWLSQVSFLCSTCPRPSQPQTEWPPRLLRRPKNAPLFLQLSTHMQSLPSPSLTRSSLISQ